MTISVKRLTSALFFLSLFSFGYAQEPDLESLKKIIWGNNSPASQNTTFPAKWENESGVVLYRENEVYYLRCGKEFINQEFNHRRIKLLDKAAVEKYSEFSFTEEFSFVSKYRLFRKNDEGSGKIFAGFKVIKPDGKEYEVNLENTVEFKDEEGNVQKKVAIPDLEPGDIIDYFYFLYRPFKAVKMYAFRPIDALISDFYPVVEQKFSFYVAKDFRFGFNSYNGAPELKPISGNKKGFGQKIFGCDKESLIYSFVDKDREKFEETNWFYDADVLPFFKSRVFVREGMVTKALFGDLFMPEPGKVGKAPVREEYEKYLRAVLKNAKLNPMVTKHLKKKNLFKVPGKEKEMLEEALRFERYKFMVEQREYREYGTGAKALEAVPFGGYDSFNFLITFARILDMQKLDFSILAVGRREAGGLEKLFNGSDFSFVIQVNLEEPYYLFFPRYARFAQTMDFFDPSFSPYHPILYTIPGTLSEHFEDTEAYAFSYSFGKGINSLANVKIGTSSHLDNASTEVISLSLNLDSEIFSANRTLKQTGYSKTLRQRKGVKLIDICREDFEYFEDKLQMDYTNAAHQKSKYRAELDKTLKEEEETQKEYLEVILKNDMPFEVSNYQQPKMVSLGRTPQNPALEYQESFELKGGITKAGPNYLLEIPKLIGSQVGLDEKDINREYDVYYDYARSFNNEIFLEIPEGFTAVGLENLNVEIENDLGYFISTAKVEGNTLKIKTQKAYKTNFVSLEDWPKAVAFLEAAFQFTQERILLKKG